jgi:streptogramin lyase
VVCGHRVNEVGCVDTATNKVTHFPMLSAKSGPRRIKIAKDGLAWVNQTNTNKLARIDPKTWKVTEWDIR